MLAGRRSNLSAQLNAISSQLNQALAMKERATAKQLETLVQSEGPKFESASTLIANLQRLVAPPKRGQKRKA